MGHIYKKMKAFIYTTRIYIMRSNLTYISNMSYKKDPGVSECRVFRYMIK